MEDDDNGIYENELELVLVTMETWGRIGFDGGLYIFFDSPEGMNNFTEMI